MSSITLLQSTLNLLRSLPLFSRWDEEALISLEAHCRIDTFEREQVIFFQGDPPERFWIVRHGRVKIVRNEEDGREVIFEIIPPGEVFGGSAIFLPEQPGTAQAFTRVETVSFPSRIYEDYLREHPALAINMIRMLGARLHSLLEMHVLAGERVERRLAHILLKLAHRVGRAQPEGILITIPLSRQDLADMCGTTLETAIRTMSRFREKGVVKTLRGGYILIKDIEKLRQLARP